MTRLMNHLSWPSRCRPLRGFVVLLITILGSAPLHPRLMLPPPCGFCDPKRLERNLHTTKKHVKVVLAGPWRTQRILIKLDAVIKQVTNEPIQIPVSAEKDRVRAV